MKAVRVERGPGRSVKREKTANSRSLVDVMCQGCVEKGHRAGDEGWVERQETRKTHLLTGGKAARQAPGGGVGEGGDGKAVGGRGRRGGSR